MVTNRSNAGRPEKIAAGLCRLLILLTALANAACGEHDASLARVAEGNDGKPYVVLDDELWQVRQDFNNNRGRVRLLFIVGDTCGICLRGMADLNDEFVARAQNDDRLVTLVVHVPTMGAEEEHVTPAIPLMDGPRVLHYWDESGISGVNVGSTLETGGIYAWDVWLAYGPDAVWRGEEPPEPEFWMHQLSPFPPELKLDAKRFGEMTLALMNDLKQAPLASLDSDEDRLVADGTEIGWVGQPLSVPVRQHIQGTGGYKALKAVCGIQSNGTVEAFGKTAGFVQQENEPGLTRTYVDGAALLPAEIEQVLESGWELHGPVFEWKERRHRLRMGGMLKIGASLAWKVFIKRAQGDRRIVYIDSHSGYLVRTDFLTGRGELLFSIHFDDFREVDGLTLPFGRSILDPHGSLIAVEKIDEISLSRSPPETANHAAKSW